MTSMQFIMSPLSLFLTETKVFYIRAEPAMSE